MNAFFIFISGQDDKDSTHGHRAGRCRAGSVCRTAITTRRRTTASKKMRDQYVEHVTKMLTLLGEPAPKAAEEAKKIMALETTLAKPARTRVELRDPQKNYNKMRQAELQELTPEWNWADYFKEIKLTRARRHQCRPAGFFQGGERCLQKRRRSMIGRRICAGT